MSILKNDHLDDDLPVPAHLMEPTDPAERRRLLAEAEASIAAGRGVPHAQARAWLSELAAGRPAKAPCAR
jgi:hypothetical protein